MRAYYSACRKSHPTTTSQRKPGDSFGTPRKWKTQTGVVPAAPRSKPKAVPLLLACGCVAGGLAGGDSALAQIFLRIDPTNSGQLAVAWTNSSAVLETASNWSGLWLEIADAPNPYLLAPTSTASFFRL